jgi:hypothetical protein
MREMSSKVVQRFDQELQELRASYLALPETERRDFRAWLEQLVDAIEKQPLKSLRIAIKVTIDNSIADENGDIVYDGTARFSAVVMRDAIRAWDDGEEFTPPLGGICR